jgi:hypothetical protein
MGVVGSADGRPTAQSQAVFTELSRQLDRELGNMRRALNTALPAINGMLKDANLPAIVPKAVEQPAPNPVAAE